MTVPTVLLYVNASVSAGTFFRLDDPARGVLDNTTYPLAGDIALDITSESQSISITRGRRSEFETIAAGTATISWPNDKRQFDPDYAGSIFYGLDLEGKRLQILFDGIVVFDGVTEDWAYTHQIVGTSWVTVSAVDAFGALGRAEFDDWTTTQEAAGARITEVLDRNEARFGANRDLDAGVSTLQADNVTYGSNVLNYLQLVAKSDLGRLFVARTGELTFRDRHATLDKPAGAVFADTETAGILFQAIERTRGTELIYNRVSVDRAGGVKQTSQDLTSQGKYGIRSQALSGLLLNDDADSAAMTDYLRELYAYPIPHIKSVTVVLDGMKVDKRSIVFQTDLADVAEVLFTPDGLGAQIDQLVIVEGISHTLAPTGTHSATLSFSTADGRSFFRLDDPARGLLDAGNVLSF